MSMDHLVNRDTEPEGQRELAQCANAATTMTAATNSTGAIAWREHLTPFGEVWSPASANLQNWECFCCERGKCAVRRDGTARLSTLAI